MPKKPDDIRPPFSKEDEEEIQRILEEAQINLDDFFTIPDQPDPVQGPDHKINPNVPEGRQKESWSHRGKPWRHDREHWQPGCGEPFSIHIAEAWTPPPAGLAGKFKLWAGFATVRAILICLRNEKCRRVHPLGCEHSYEHRYPTGDVGCGAEFVFECVEI